MFSFYKLVYIVLITIFGKIDPESDRLSNALNDHSETHRIKPGR